MCGRVWEALLKCGSYLIFFFVVLPIDLFAAPSNMCCYLGKRRQTAIVITVTATALSLGVSVFDMVVFTARADPWLMPCLLTPGVLTLHSQTHNCVQVNNQNTEDKLCTVSVKDKLYFICMTDKYYDLHIVTQRLSYMMERFFFF